VLPLTVAEIVAATRAEVVGGPLPEGPVTISTDTRALQAGQVFLALRGPNFDAHDFVDQAFARGAVAALVSRRPRRAAGPLLLVPDTLRALGEVAASWRRRFTCPVLAVTGSTGKTTTKELAAAILARRGPVLKTAANYNNEIGVPLAVFGLAPEHQGAVFELGMRAPGEITYLAGIVQPTVAVITNVGHSHLERLGSLEAIADAKAEVLEHLPPDGVAVLNADDAQYLRLRQRVAGRALTFSAHGKGDVRAEGVAFRENLYPEFRLCAPQGEIQVAMALPGRHNLANGLAAAAACLAAGSTLHAVAAGLAQPLVLSKRLHLRTAPSGAAIIDDCYNASPASMQVALELLAGMSADTRVAVLGDMKELGPDEADLHRQIGALVADSGVDRLIALGPLAGHYAEGAGDLPQGVVCTLQVEEAASLAAESARAGTIILVKGSRAMGMERIVERLLS